MALKTDGKFLYCNKTACQILNISEEDVLGKPASALMPDQIRVNHELFVRRFFQDGLNRLVGKVRNMYIKDFNGYIKPCQFFINFYYTSKFSYSVIMHIDPILSMTYFGTSQLINMKYVMILLCDENNVI
jgi:PAS domain S-box-containing protein